MQNCTGAPSGLGSLMGGLLFDVDWVEMRWDLRLGYGGMEAEMGLPEYVQTFPFHVLSFSKPWSGLTDTWVLREITSTWHVESLVVLGPAYL